MVVTCNTCTRNNDNGEGEESDGYGGESGRNAADGGDEEDGGGGGGGGGGGDDEKRFAMRRRVECKLASPMWLNRNEV